MADYLIDKQWRLPYTEACQLLPAPPEPPAWRLFGFQRSLQNHPRSLSLGELSGTGAVPTFLRLPPRDR